MSSTNALAKVEEVGTSLSVNLTDQAINEMRDQRNKLKSFVSSQLTKGIKGDYAEIPGTKQVSLLKPGAEKLANIFKLGSRIVNSSKDVDIEKKFAMLSYTIEIFHIPTGKTVAQCEGTANSQEKKYKNVPFADVLNTLGKMAQKRGYVGGVIMAVGGSDFFTQDIEDENDARAHGMRPEPQRVQANVPRATSARSQTQNQPAAQAGNPGEYIVPFGKTKGRALFELSQDELSNMYDWLTGLDEPKGTALECLNAVKAYLGES